MRNFKMTVAYDGTRYRGWQRLGDSDSTIQGKLEAVLSRMMGCDIEVSGSGRTDAGAHAKGQVASFHAETAHSCTEIFHYLNQYLPEDIGVLSLEEASPRFHARLNAVRKTYCYRVWNSQIPCVFERRYVYVMTDALDLDAMRTAAAHFLGEHDFLAFCSNKHFKKSSVRRIDIFEIVRVGPEIQFLVSGNGFLYNMVRIMVGTLLEVGKGERGADEIPMIFEARARENAGVTVPAKGLCLQEVFYA